MESVIHVQCSIFIVVILLLFDASASGFPVKDCIFEDHRQHDPSMDRITKLLGKSFSMTKDGYSYKVGICVNVDETQPNVAVMQHNLSDHRNYALGQLTKADIIAGKNWVLLEYRGGTSYGTHCQASQRRVLIMLTCDSGQSEGVLTLVEEQNKKAANCYYLFELFHEAICQQHVSHGLSLGSVLCVIFVCVVGLYLLGGFAYQRLVVGAKGFEQIPNYAFWVDFGNLQADGCSFLCRCGGSDGSGSGQRLYRGIGDDQLAAEDEEDDQDEHLLPM